MGNISNSGLSQVVTCIVLTYNRCNYLLKCLEAIRCQSHSVANIIVVDNGSTDSTRQEIEKIISEGQQILYINTQKNIGSSGGFSVGFKLASGFQSDWVWVMDDDVTAHPNCLEELIRNCSDYHVIQPYRYYHGDDYVKSECKKLNFKNPFSQQKIDFIDRPSKSGHAEIACFPFEGPLIKYETFVRNAPPIEKYFIIGDDTEYSIRLSKNGAKFKMCPTALMERQIKPSRYTKLNWKAYYTIRNNILNDAANSSAMFTVTRAALSAFRLLIGGLYRRRKIAEFYLIIRSTLDGLLGIYRPPEEIFKKF